jgi:NAD(P)-dependent dehydrogenase (short-subunit alcohol dehydrogenase family)
MRLDGKVVIVTGGAGGIGEAITRLFVREGAIVVVADYSEHGQVLVDELRFNGQPALFARVDISEEDQVRELVEQTVSAYGRLDIMVANAGIGDATPAHELPLRQWQRLMDVNLTGVFLSDKYAIIQMLQQSTGGAIVNIASILGHVGQTPFTSYAAAKGGVVNLTRSLGVTYAKNGIRVNAVSPGYIDTPLLGTSSVSTLGKLANLHPIGRLGRTEEVANAVLFLASDEASFVVGTHLLVDGGYTAQ